MKLCILLLLMSFTTLKATISRISRTLELLRNIESNSVELRLRARQCVPLFTFLIDKLLRNRFLGYDPRVLVPFHTFIEQSVDGVRFATLSPRGQICIDKNRAMARELGRRLMFDSTCLRIELTAIYRILGVLLKSIFGDPTGNCPIPIICVLTRLGIRSLVVSVRALINLAVNGLKLVLKILTFLSSLQKCRRDGKKVEFLMDVFGTNFQMCQLVP